MSTVTIPCDMRRASWASKDGSDIGAFNPEGQLSYGYPEEAHKRLNPVAWKSGAVTWSGRIFVGFNVGSKEVFTMDDLVELVKKVRKKQVNKPDASFIYQKGLYTSDRDGKIVKENGAQIVILNLPDYKTTPAKFEKQMIGLAEEIVKQFEQEAVYLEMQRSGVVKSTSKIIAA